MSNVVISLMFAAGFSAWIYQKLMKYSGNNTQQAAIATAISGVLTFIVVLILLGIILP